MCLFTIYARNHCFYSVKLINFIFSDCSLRLIFNSLFVFLHYSLCHHLSFFRSNCYYFPPISPLLLLSSSHAQYNCIFSKYLTPTTDSIYLWVTISLCFWSLVYGVEWWCDFCVDASVYYLRRCFHFPLLWFFVTILTHTTPHTVRTVSTHYIMLHTADIHLIGCNTDVFIYHRDWYYYITQKRRRP